MLKLLRANFAKLLKSATFWIFFGAYVLYSILVIIFTTPNPGDFLPETYIRSLSIGTLVLGYGIAAPVPALVVAITCAVIFGSEFQSGIMRNKIIMGHTRSQIYVVNLITAVMISFILVAVYLLIFCILALPLIGNAIGMGNIYLPAKDLSLIFFDGALMLIAYSSIFTLVTMTSKNPTAALIVSVVLVFASFFLMMYFDTAIFNVNEFFYEDAEIFGVHYYKPIPNPKYPGKGVIDFCNFVVDLLPTGRCYRITGSPEELKWQTSLYSLVWIAATSGAGMLVFKKSNIK